MRRPVLTVLGCVMVCGLLAGCAIDYPAPELTMTNELDEQVVVVVQTDTGTVDRRVDAGGENSITLNRCIGYAIVVKDEDGVVLGRVDEAACPDKTLTIRADGTLDYS